MDEILSELAQNLAVGHPAQTLPGGQSDVVGNKVHAAVRKYCVHASDMAAPGPGAVGSRRVVGP